MNNYYSPYDTQNSDEMMRRSLYYQAKARQEKKEIRKLGNITGCILLLYLAIQYASAFVLQILGLYDKFSSSAIFQYSFTIISVEILAVMFPFGLMSLLNKKHYKTDIIPSKKLSLKTHCLWIGFGMLCCVGADYLVGIIMGIFNVFGYQLTQGESLDPNSLFACVMCLIGTAVIPPICEEFAMRCCALGLLKNYGKAFGVVAVSIVFGLIHGNVIQFIFAGLVGLILGYVTIKTDSVIPAILIHGFNNGMSVVTTLCEYFLNEKASEYSTYVLFVLWIIVGAVSTVILASKKGFKNTEPKRPREPYENSLSSKILTFFFVPGMILPFIYFIFSNITSIEKM